MLTSRYAIGIHGYILVYSVASRATFSMISTIHQKILNYTGAADVPAVIVGQKSDVADEVRRVSEAEGKALADELGCRWIETSAKDNANVETAFQLLLAKTEADSGSPEPKPVESKCLLM